MPWTLTDFCFISNYALTSSFSIRSRGRVMVLERLAWVDSYFVSNYVPSFTSMIQEWASYASTDSSHHFVPLLQQNLPAALPQPQIACFSCFSHSMPLMPSCPKLLPKLKDLLVLLPFLASLACPCLVYLRVACRSADSAADCSFRGTMCASAYSLYEQFRTWNDYSSSSP